MKKILIGSILVTGWWAGSSCTQQNQQDGVVTGITTSQAPVMKFETASHDFGTIQEGQIITRTFSFTNTGKTPLIIENAVASCGCTVPDWPRKPVASGAKADIKVEFNSRGKAGPQQKTITIYANTQPRESVLLLVGAVEMVPQ